MMRISLGLLFATNESIDCQMTISSFSAGGAGSCWLCIIVKVSVAKSRITTIEQFIIGFEIGRNASSLRSISGCTCFTLKGGLQSMRISEE